MKSTLIHAARGTALVLALTVLAGCVGASPATNEPDADGVLTVQVGTMGTYEPYSFEDADGTLTGYDLEVLRLIEEVDPGLRFEFTGAPWDTLFPGLDSGRYHLLANQIASNADREARYLLTENHYGIAVSQIIVAEGATGIEDLDDLAGRAVGTTVGDNFTRYLEDWNAEHGEVLDLSYYEEDVTTILQDIAHGRIDATLNNPVTARAKAESQGIAVEPVGERIHAEPTHFIAARTDEGAALIARLDAALDVLVADGRLSALSVEWFGEDYSR